MNQYRIDQYLPISVQKAFRFFSDERNLNKMTPFWYQVTVLRKNGSRNQKGTKIDYRFFIQGIPLKWRSHIIEWRPGFRFVYVQEIGPYASFKHEHRFKKKGKGCVMTDLVFYELKGGAFLQRALAPWVQKSLEGIFEYRKRKAKELFCRSSISGRLG